MLIAKLPLHSASNHKAKTIGRKEAEKIADRLWKETFAMIMARQPKGH